MALTTLPTAAFATGSVGTSQLADGAVTTEKLVADVNFRNIIINGDMSIAQRGTSFSSISSAVPGDYGIDRFQFLVSTAGTWTMSQDTDVPTGQGFAKSLKVDCTTANASLSASSRLFIQQRLEGQMLQQLKKGTANTESVTLSFWVKSVKTGIYIAEIYDYDNDRFISKSYTVNSASTWEKKTITYAGDTSGTLNNDNALSLGLIFWLGAGSNFTSGTLGTSWQSTVNVNEVVGQVNLADSTDNNFWITGVQLEVGTSASDFEFLPYDVNLDRCLRYYQVFVNRSITTNPVVGTSSFLPAFWYNTTQVRSVGQFLKPMRASPSLDVPSGSDYYRFNWNASLVSINDFTINSTNTTSFEIRSGTLSGGTGGLAGFINANNLVGNLAFNSEL